MKFVFLFFAFTQLALANVTLKNVQFVTEASKGKIVAEFSDDLKSAPELIFQGRVSSILISNVTLEKDIQGNVAFGSENKDTNFKTQKVDDKSFKIKTTFPFNIESKKDLVFLTIAGNKLIATYPRVAVAASANNQANAISAKMDKVLDESYLNKLLADENTKNENKLPEVTDEKIVNAATETPNIVENKEVTKEATKEDKELSAFVNAQTKVENKNVVTEKSRNKNQSNDSFSFMGYVTKFAAFLGVVLLMFYGVVSLMKKGVFKRGKLGFLQNTEKVEVLSTTYIAPKKSLLMIKAHKQVFLVSNTDAGIQLISEIQDVSGLVKDTEKEVSGNNFDDSLYSANLNKNIEEKVKLKNLDQEPHIANLYNSAEEKKDTVKFSDEIKKKVKKLKPLEFN
jgi:flagellar biogenesis protein FliO